MKLIYIVGLIFLFIYYSKKKEDFKSLRLCSKLKNIIEDKQIILILGEQYWFDNEEDDIKESKILLNFLKGINNYKVIISNHPVDFFKKLKHINKEKLKFVFLFQDIICDSYLNKMKINTVFNYLIKLRKDHNVIFYPGIEETNYFSSKKYYQTLLNNMYYSVLPHTSVIEIKKFSKKDFLFLVRKIKYICDNLIKKFEHVVIKKGYSYNSVQVAIIEKKIVNDIDKLAAEILKLEKKDSFDIDGNALKWETNIDRFYIIQGYNEIVNENDLGEFRVFFIDGKQKYVAWGDDYPNLCVDDIIKNDNFKYNSNDDDKTVRSLLNLNNSKSIEKLDPEISKEVVKFSKKVYDDFIKIFWKNKVKHPIIFRTDVSWAEDKHFQDKHSIYLKKSKKWIRLYVNELEIDPTHFFYNNFLCKTNNLIKSAEIQTTVFNLILNYIEKHSK